MLEITKIDNTFKSGYKNKRDCFDLIMDYLLSDNKESKVCAIFGLRRTGKTVLMKQCIENLPENVKNTAELITCNINTDFYEIANHINEQIDNGYKYFFIDEITYSKNFQELGEILSDQFVSIKDARIVITGTDSLGLILPAATNMYDRVMFVNTTYTPFSEYSRLVNCNSIDEYIKKGAVLNYDTTPFIEYKNYEEYVRTAIVSNIINSIKKSEGTRKYPAALTELYRQEELENAIQRMINKYSQEITLNSLREQISIPPLNASVKLIANDSSSPDLSILKNIDIEKVCNKAAELLGIIQNKELKITLTKEHETQLKDFLKEIDVVTEIPVISSYEDKNFTNSIEMFSHPGMYHANIHYLLNELKNNDNWLPEATTEQKKNLLAKTENWILGTITENCIINDVYRCISRKNVQKDDIFSENTGRWYVSKLRVSKKITGDYDHEVDLIIFDKKYKETFLFEIKHSIENVPQQSKHIENENFIKYIEDNFGKIKYCAVLYNNNNDFSTKIPRISSKSFLNAIYKQKKLNEFSMNKVIEDLKENKIQKKSKSYDDDWER